MLHVHRRWLAVAKIKGDFDIRKINFEGTWFFLILFLKSGMELTTLPDWSGKPAAGKGLSDSRTLNGKPVTVAGKALQAKLKPAKFKDVREEGLPDSDSWFWASPEGIALCDVKGLIEFGHVGQRADNPEAGGGVDIGFNLSGEGFGADVDHPS